MTAADSREATATVAEFLYHEAALLDAGDIDAWLALYADDATYTIPQWEPSHEGRVHIVHDDRRRLAERVARLRSGFAYSQEPASRTVHVVGNVRIAGGDDERLEVSSTLIVAEVRRRRQSIYAGSVAHVLRAVGGSFQIVRKEIRLANSELPLGNLTFLI
jgi:3-phenylpropionate/cinnamic acid dioxygenase small subunit